MTMRDPSAAMEEFDESVDRMVRKLLVGLGAIMIAGFSLTLMALGVGTCVILTRLG